MTTKKPGPCMAAKDEREFVRQAYEKFPEAAMCFGVESFRYGAKEDPKRFRFVFVDYEENSKRHVITEADAIRGLRVFVDIVRGGGLQGLDLPPNFISPADNFDVLGEWEAMAFDALAQCAMFGEVIYG